MADKRKLVTEMEKCFKKIDEGLEIFEETMSKLDEVNSDNQREKIQDELKKEIKKLQRLREQVKNWQGSSDIKDKEKLNFYRRLIEQRMETFKGIEREFKTKPHSNQGLSTEEKMDPKEKEKAETLEWLNNQIRAIQGDIDRTESKIEGLSTTEPAKKAGKSKDRKGKAGKKADKEQIETWKKRLDRVNFHLENLEVCMRMLMNDKLDIKAVNSKLREPLDMYIDALESDNYDELENLEPDDVYGELGLGDYISQLAATALATHPPAPQPLLPPPPTQTMVTKPPETKSSETRLPGTKPSETKPSEIKPPETVSPETRSPETKPQEAKPPETKPSAPQPLIIQTTLPKPLKLSDRVLPSWFPKKFPFVVNNEYFAKLELGTLFFSFYYMEGTRSQLLAASRLKNLSWRFHTRYLMWFRRKVQPIESTKAYERGTYYYFDYSIWDIRENSDFIFYYKYLEDIEI